MKYKNLLIVTLAIFVLFVTLATPKFINQINSEGADEVATNGTPSELSVQTLGSTSDILPILPDHKGGFFIVDTGTKTPMLQYYDGENITTYDDLSTWLNGKGTCVAAKAHSQNLFLFMDDGKNPNNNINFYKFTYIPGTKESENSNSKIGEPIPWYSAPTSLLPDTVNETIFAIDSTPVPYFIYSSNIQTGINKVPSAGSASYPPFVQSQLYESIFTNPSGDKLYAFNADTTDKKLTIYSVENSSNSATITGLNIFSFLTDNIIITSSGDIYKLPELGDLSLKPKFTTKDLTPLTLKNKASDTEGVKTSKETTAVLSATEGETKYILTKTADNQITAYEVPDGAPATPATGITCVATKKLDLNLGEGYTNPSIEQIITSGKTCVAVISYKNSENTDTTGLVTIDKPVSDWDPATPEKTEDPENPSLGDNDNNGDQGNVNDQNQEDDKEQTSGDNNPSDKDNTPDGETKPVDKISSSTYKIDFDEYIITDIPYSTTMAKFKENIDYTGYEISFKNHKGEEPKSRRTLGTNWTVSFTRDGKTQTFTIIIQGDTTGEGNINSNDINTFRDYLGGKSEMAGSYMLAADLNNDGVINTLDLLAIYKLTKELS